MYVRHGLHGLVLLSPSDPVLQIDGLPSDAQVWVDGQLVEGTWVDADRTSWTCHVTAGEHHVRVEDGAGARRGGRYLVTRYGLFEPYARLPELPAETTP